MPKNAKTVLIVEDVNIDRRLLWQILSRDYTVLEAENGQDALNTLHQQKGDVAAIVTDLVMPVLDGYELIRKIMADPVYQQIPVVVTTGSADDEAQLRAISLGAAAYTMKPYHPDLLRHTVQNCIRMHEMAALTNTLYHDSLTKLLNRTAFSNEAKALIDAQPAGTYMLSCLNIERFTVINDQHGTDVGDDVLCYVAQCLEACAKEIGAVVGRFSSDKFAILYPVAQIHNEAVAKLHLMVVRPPCITRRIKIRIGRYRIIDPGISVNSMFDRASMAEASIKGRYDQFIAEYDEAMRQHILHEQHVVADMYWALREGQFEPWFQPQYDHVTGALTGAEALVRWRHPKDGLLVPPGEFIPVFERNGFIYEMDKSVWEQVCALLRKWIDQGRAPLPVSVNISRYDLFTDDFFDVITGLVKKYNIPDGLLRLEVTESAFSEQTDVIVAKIKKLIDLGFTVEIDDFGSGYSSLNTLKDVPASILKMDMKFLENSEDSRRGGSIIESIIRMAKWLGMSVIAEGVESRQQADYLASIGCNIIQGYYYGRPMPTADYEALAAKSPKSGARRELETVETFNNEAFWDPDSLDSLVFNHFSGGAFIFEYHNGHYEMLRVNNEFAGVFHSSLSNEEILKMEPFSVLQESEREMLHKVVERAFHSGEAERCEFYSSQYSPSGEGEYIRLTIRCIAALRVRQLFYAYVDNITAERVAEQKAREAEMESYETAVRLRVILENVDSGVSAISVNGKDSHFLFANDRYFSMLGYTQESFTAEGATVFDLLHPDDLESFKTYSRRIMMNEKLPRLIYRMRHRDGGYRWLSSHVSLVSFPNQGGLVQITVTDDITAEKTAKDALAAAEQERNRSSAQLSAIMDNIDGGVTATVFNENGSPDLLFANDRFFQLFGVDRAACAAGQANPTDCVLEEDRPVLLNAGRAAQKTREPFAVLYRVKPKDGALRWLQGNVAFINMPGVDQPVELSVILDVTDQVAAHDREMAAERKLRATSEREHAILRHAPCGISAVLLGEGEPEFLFANEQFYDLLGCTKETYSAIEDGNYGHIHSEDIRRVRAEIRECYATGSSALVEYRTILPDGAIRWLRTALNITRFSGIDVPVELGVFTDITETVERDEQAKFLTTLSRSMLSQPDAEVAIHRALEQILAYFDGNRAYIFEADADGSQFSNTYEICAPGVSAEIDHLQNVSAQTLSFWTESFRTMEFISIDVDSIPDSRVREKEVLRAQNIRALLAAPIYQDGKYVGFLGVDDPSRQQRKTDFLSQLGDYAAVLLMRRDLLRSARAETQALHAIMNGIPGGFGRLQVSEDGGLIPLYFSGGLLDMIGIDHQQFSGIVGHSKDLAALSQIHRGEWDAARATLEAALHLGQSRSKIIRLHRSDRSEVSIEIFCSRQINDGQTFLNVYFMDASEQELAQREQQELLDNLPCAAVLYRYDKKALQLIRLNRRYWELVDRSAKKSEYINIEDSIHPGDLPLVMQELNAAIRQRRDFSSIVRIRTGKSGYRAFRVIGKIVRQADHSYHLYSTYTPVSDEAVSTQELLPVALNTVLAASSDFVFVKDKDLHYLCGNHAAAQEMGLQDERAIIGITDSDVFERDFAEQCGALERQVLETGEAVVDAEICRVSRDGSSIYYSNSRYPVRDVTGSIVGIYGVSRNVTHVKNTESQFRLLADSVHAGLSTIEVSPRTSRVLYFNEAAYSFSGYTREEYEALAQKSAFALILKDDRPAAQAAITGLSHGEIGATTRFIERCQGKDGSIYWFSITATLAEQHGKRSLINLIRYDITEQKKLEQQLRMSADEYRTAVQHSDICICRFNVAQKSLAMSRLAMELYGFPAVLTDVPFGPVRRGEISPETAAAYILFYQSIFHGKKEGSVTYQRKLNGKWTWLDARFTSLFSDAGEPISAVVSFRDITKQVEREAIYRKWEQSLRDRPRKSFTQLHYNLNSGASYDSMEGSLLQSELGSVPRELSLQMQDFSQSYVHAEDQAGFAAMTNVDAMLAAYYRGMHSDTMEFREILPGGRTRWLSLSVELVRYPNSSDVGAYMLFEDIDERKRAALLTKENAESDPLTGLLNRKAFESRLLAALANRKKESLCAFFMLDLDSFKQINDTYGHSAGDQDLTSIAQTLRSVLRRDDLICRMGGDEFFVLLCNVPSLAVVEMKAREICRQIQQIPLSKISSSASIGIAVCPSDGEDFNTLYHKADRALYYVKEHGKKNFAFYTAEMD